MVLDQKTVLKEASKPSKIVTQTAVLGDNRIAIYYSILAKFDFFFLPKVKLRPIVLIHCKTPH